jgi:hypothetical protein
MRQLKFYVTIAVPNELLSDDYHSDTMIAVQESIDELVERLSEDAYIVDLEIK